MKRPMLTFDLDAFLGRSRKVGAERATIEAVTNLLQLTHKAMVRASQIAPRRKPQGEKP